MIKLSGKYQMNNGTSKAENVKASYYRLVFIIVFSLFVIVIGAYISNFHTHIISKSVSDWGAFGDYIGGLLNPVLSLVSVVLILVTIKQQEVSLRQNAEQIEISINEVKKSVAAQEIQARTAEEQFKELQKKSKIEDYLRVLNMLIIDLEKMINESIPCFRDSKEKRTLRSQLLELVERKNPDQIKDFLEENNYFYQRFKNTLSYFESQLLKFEGLGQDSAYSYFESRVSEYSSLLVAKEFYETD